jgi:carbon monoxide dehydrogenase subunit G
MGHISRTIHVEATPEQAFDLLTNPARFPEWMVPASEVKDITGTPGTVGLGWTTASTFAGRKMENRMSVTAVERPRSFEVKGTGGGISGTATLHGRFEPAAGGTDITIENDYEMPLGFIGDAADKLFVEKSFAESWDKSLVKFKALVEADAPAHA